ncbi:MULTISPECIES: alcohol dehydrogenase AdhP [Acetobacter]|uniref:alcohol dehydrogenase n=2 Tax=Acetobacter TaxID=434 RepID=A0AAN1PJ00_9PROT|nr:MULTISPECIES: alcohol dehydrogenase AdhP [Acetobacter]ANA12623.1 alcohol dehydrogenase [Acetobacter oryzifermentans]ASL39011.1 zinc-dependent alcohol dehydrogenase [Acetobacter oryzifermentans]AXN01138.1 alcohol dehydrogenase AdhP [Acetobacter pomorum]KAA8396489.1 alcohol dehydrogenase AdhP [Acetobacter sp. DmW_125124]KAA8398866.1 alcohol dehydrogenase AdhP [Acetobacter sp. DmW_125128]
MSGKMKAAVVHEFGKPLTIEELDIPTIKPTQILVKMIACGVCHTDLHAASGDWPKKPHLPFIPGHEGVGTVVQVGSEVDWVKEGDVVGVPWLYSACGHCEHCLAGWETLCPKQEETGYSVNGCFAEYVVADPNYIAHLPKGVDPVKVAPVLCAGLTVYKGLKMTDTRAGNWVAISGVGGLGQMAVQYAVAMGLNVVAVDIDDEKLATAKKLGAMYTVNARNTDPATFMQEKVGGVHGGLITAVSTKAFSQAMGYVRAGGTLVLNGLPPGDFPISIFDMVMNAITIRGSIVGTRLDMIEALSFFAEGKVTSVTTTDRIDNINAIFDALKNGRVEGRVVLDFRN